MAILSPPQPPQAIERHEGASTAPLSSPPPQGGGSKTFDLSDLKHYLHLVARRFWLVALCFIVSLSVAVVTLLRQVDTYQSSARLLISAGLPYDRRIQFDEVRQVQQFGGDFMATQIQSLSSRDIRERARQVSSFPPAVLDANQVSVRVHQVWQTSMLQITVTALDGAVAADYANAMARSFEEFKAEERLTMSQGTFIGLLEQINILKRELGEAEDRLLVFRREHRILGLSQRNNLASEIMGQLAERAARYRLERMLLQNHQPLLQQADAEVLLQTLSGLQPVPQVAVQEAPLPTRTGAPSLSEALLVEQRVLAPTWVALRREQALLDSELEALQRIFRDAHPKVQETRRRLAEIRRQIDVEVSFAERQFQAQLESLHIREQAAQRVEQEWEEEAVETSRTAMEYEGLDREVERNRVLLDRLLDRLREVDIAARFEADTVRIIEEAIAPSHPQSPRRLQNLFLAALLGLGVGLGLVIGLEFIDDSLRYPDDVARLLGLPFFGVIPSADWDPDDLASHLLSNQNRSSPLAEAYRNVRSSLLFAIRGRGAQCLAVMSAVPKEGKTTTSINLAVSLAQAGGRVLLVDADLRRGELHKYFGLDGGRGLSDILAGQTKPESVVHRTGISGLDVIATGPFPPNPSEMVLGREFQSFMEYAKRNYDHVLLDCPPVMAVSEASVLASMADGVLFVVWGGHTSRKLSRSALQIMQGKGANVFGCVLNNLEFGRVGYYYYTGYYYDAYYREEDAAKTEV